MLPPTFPIPDLPDSPSVRPSGLAPRDPLHAGRAGTEKMRWSFVTPASNPRAIAASANSSACGSAANARGVSRNMLRDIWSSTITAASAVCGSVRSLLLARDTIISCKPRKYSRMLASNAASFSNHWSGSVCSNQNFKTSSTHPSLGSSMIAKASKIYAPI